MSNVILQVSDSNEVWHAAKMGTGVLCGVARLKIDKQGFMAKLVDTSKWCYGWSRVDCIACIEKMAHTPKIIACA